MLKRILYSIRYRLNKLNFEHIQGQNNNLNCLGIMTGCTVEIKGDSNLIDIKEGVILNNLKITIRGNHTKLIINENVQVKAGEFWLEDNFSELIIHKNVTIEEAHIAVTEDYSKITIEDDCMLAKGIEIRCGDSHSILDDNGIRINPAKSILIGRHVWIGSKAMILKGVNIGQGSIVAAGSIVTKEIPDNTLVSGIPAKIMKQKINWTRQRI